LGTTEVGAGSMIDVPTFRAAIQSWLALHLCGLAPLLGGFSFRAREGPLPQVIPVVTNRQFARSHERVAASLLRGEASLFDRRFMANLVALDGDESVMINSAKTGRLPGVRFSC